MSELVSTNDNVLKVGSVEFEAWGDRVLILEDEFKTGYECTRCNGEGKVACENCGGSGTLSYGGPEMTCAVCNKGGKQVCPVCEGKGGLLIAPETAQRRPTTGTVMSVGPTCKYAHVNESFLYSSFAGYSVDMTVEDEDVTIRILHETELLARVKGHLVLRQLRGKTEIALYNK